MCAYMLSYVYSVLHIKIGSIFECIYGKCPEVYCFPYLIIIIIIIGHIVLVALEMRLKLMHMCMKPCEWKILISC